MQSAHPDQPSLAWLTYALLTVAAWGVYGIFLHGGQSYMKDAAAGRYKAFLFVGIAYFLTAVLAPLALLWLKGATWSFTASGCWWSLLAGTAGAIGAFFVLVAFGSGGSPAVVMTIVFAGAPVVNSVVALLFYPPPGGWGAIRWPFFAGIVLAALGGALVTLYRPPPAKAPVRTVAHQAAVEVVPNS